MKILYIVNVLADEKNVAAEPFVKAQIDSVQRAGHDVHIFNVRGNESKLNYLHAIFRVRRLLQQQKFDIIHGHYVYSGLVAALQKSPPAIVSFMGSDLNGSPKSTGRLQLRGHFDVLLSKLLQLFIDGIIVKSKKMQELLIRPQKSIVLPNGVDFSLFRPIQEAEARRELHLDPYKKYVLFVGNHKIPNKCFPIVEGAVAMLQKKHGDYELLLAYGVPQAKIHIYMNAANILALPSLLEGSPNVIKEAMACNLPIVATDVGDIREVVAGVDGCRIAERNPEAFAEAIEDILNRTKRTDGRKAINDLAIEKVATRLVGFYQEIIASQL